MPSTRLRSQSRSQLRVSPVVRQSQLEPQTQTQTLDTLSTAVLPVSYTINLASTHTISSEQNTREYIRGQEHLSDGVRRINDKDGDLWDLRARKRRRVGEKTSGAGSVKLDKEVYWYTANLKYPCSC